MNKEEAAIIIEEVLDTLVEVGNGTTQHDLHEAADQLFRFRNEWFNKIEVWVEPEEDYNKVSVEIEMADTINRNGRIYTKTVMKQIIKEYNDKYFPNTSAFIQKEKND